MGKLIIEIRISKKTGKSAENSVMDLIPILFVIIEKVFNRLKMSTNLMKVGSGKWELGYWKTGSFDV